MVVRPRHQSQGPAVAIRRATSTASSSSTSKTIDIILKDPNEPLLNALAAPGFVVLERKVVEAHGGAAAKDAKEKDKATAWLNENSGRHRRLPLAAGSATSRSSSCATSITGAASRPSSASSSATSSDGAAQLLAVRRGDIDAAFNLIPEQIASLKSEPNVRLDPLASLDFVYMALTQEPEFNKALAVKEARQAIGYAIDYDGIKNVDARRRGAAAGALSCRSASAARPRRSRGRSASARTSARRRNCSPRPASPTASSSRSSTATPPCRA